MSYAPGQVIARKYRLVRELGVGGMGSVWAAHNVGLDTHVAIKLLRSDLHSEEIEQRLLTEARTIAKLGHPGIVRVFDVGRTENGTPYIVMELLEGESLGDSLERRVRAPATRAVQILLPIADALAVAHSRGIIHRDLKPDNIFLARSGARNIQPKILDFGIAKLANQDRVGKQTEHGTVLGSPEYMAPEQARGKAEIDDRVDVWALTVVLYEIISGEPPFRGENYNAIMAAVIENEPAKLPDACDERLWQIIQRGLAKSPEERWPSMRSFGHALVGWLIQQGVTEDICNGSLEAIWLAASTPPAVDDVFSDPRSSHRPFSKDDDEHTPVRAGPNTPGVLSPPAAIATIHTPEKRRRGTSVAVAALWVLGLAILGALFHPQVRASAADLIVGITNDQRSAGAADPAPDHVDQGASPINLDAPSPTVSASAAPPLIEAPPARSTEQIAPEAGDAAGTKAPASASSNVRPAKRKAPRARQPTEDDLKEPW